MNAPLRASKLRLITGCVLLVLAALVVLFVLPDASQQKFQKHKAFEDAKKALASQRDKLAALIEEDQKLTNSRKRLETLLGSMPDQSAGRLQWELSRRLYELAQKNGVHLQSLKYGTPTREGAKGTDLEILDGHLGYYKSGLAKYPIVPGHESSGTIAALGARVTDLAERDRVVVECIQGCGECPACACDNAIACVDLASERGVSVLADLRRRAAARFLGRSRAAP